MRSLPPLDSAHMLECALVAFAFREFAYVGWALSRIVAPTWSAVFFPVGVGCEHEEVGKRRDGTYSSLALLKLWQIPHVFCLTPPTSCAWDKQALV
jgi:hypothetical protein